MRMQSVPASIALAILLVVVPAQADAAPRRHASLRESAAREGKRLASAATPVRIQPSPSAAKSKAVGWWAAIGGLAGAAGGALAPTHGNGKYLLPGGHAGTAVLLGGIGAGLGALVGYAVQAAKD